MKNKISIFIATFLLFSMASIAYASTDFNTDLHYGSNSPDVAQLQSFLVSQNLFFSPLTGGYFNLTKQAVIKFQSKNGISPTGYFGPKTRALANKMVASLVSNVTISTTTPVNQSANPTQPSKPATTSTAQTTLPVPTASEIAGIARICSIPGSSQYCTSTFWDGYNTNAVFRNGIDAMAQALLQNNGQTQQTTTQQTNCINVIKNIESSLIAGMGPNALGGIASIQAICSGQQQNQTIVPTYTGPTPAQQTQQCQQQYDQSVSSLNLFTQNQNNYYNNLDAQGQNFMNQCGANGTCFSGMAGQAQQQINQAQAGLAKTAFDYDSSLGVLKSSLQTCLNNVTQ